MHQTPQIESGFDLTTCFKYREEIELEANDDVGTNYMRYEEFLKDEQVMKAYVKAINLNKHLFRGKVVLDINCGLGVLSILAAKAGASHVYATEPTSVAGYTQRIVTDNGCKEKVTILRQKIEDLTLPVQVDIILCQWMGYFLLFEGLIESVLLARDKFLVKDGLIMPDRGVLFVATIEDEEYRAKKHNFWKKVYGVNMECMVDWVATEPSNEKINNNQVNAESCPILEVDLYKTQLGELDFSNEYKVRMTRNDYVHGLIGWFEVYFTSSHLPIRISSAPFSKGTLWKQTVFHFRDTIICHRNDQIKGTVAVKRRGKELDILISAHVSNNAGKWDLVQYYRMN